eukprot:9233450-Pyramimonas_sp.AAC.1
MPQDAEEMADLDRKAQGYVWCEIGPYWMKPQRLGWCRHCGLLDDWKVMRCDWVEEVPQAV